MCGTAVRPRCGKLGKRQGRDIHRGDGIWHGCLSAGAVGCGGPILCVYVRFGLACLLACWCVCVCVWVGVVSVVWLVRDGLRWVTRRCTYQAVREGIAHRMTIFV